MILAAGPFGLGPLELGIILLVVVVLFGATRLADIGGSLGKGIREFRRNIKDEEEEEAPAAPPPAAPTAAAPTTPVSDAAGEVLAARRCPSCGTLNPAASKHCSECGASLATPVS